MRARLAIAALATTALAVAAMTAGAAAKPAPINLHNARYCEIFEIKGALPDVTVTVWNTIGLNKCPAAKWDAIDATQLAAGRGDTSVIKNGPRHFMMDSATAAIGGTDRFGGIRMRRVATIPIASAADLVRAPYTERTIDRHNTWTYDKGRRVYELLAPNGSNYIMQSYSQIIDPQQSIGDLKSLGSRLNLPQGWTFKSKRLKRSLTLRTKSSATILQDDLQNTYQREPSKRKPSSHSVQVTGSTKTVGSTASGALEDAGTISGAPFGSGTVDLLVNLNTSDSTATGTFTISTPDGSAFGTESMTFVIDAPNNSITFTGTATFTGGTGPYRGISGTVDAGDTNTLDGQNGMITLNGNVDY